MKKSLGLLASILQYKDRVAVIKIGGEPLTSGDAFIKSFARQIQFLQKHGIAVILIHGAGPQIKASLARQSIERTRHPCGRWQTSADELTYVKRAMDRVNLELSLALQTAGCSVISATLNKRCLLSARQIDINSEDMTGLPCGVDLAGLKEIIQSGTVYITHSLGQDPVSGKFLNVNADDCARIFAEKTGAALLILGTSVDGVLDKEQNTIPIITPEIAAALKKDHIITDGMTVKVESGIAALEGGVGGVVLLNASRPAAFLKGFKTNSPLSSIIVPAKKHVFG